MALFASILAFSGLNSFQFVLECLYFLSSWPLASCGFISFNWHFHCRFLRYFFLLSLYFLGVWPFRPSFPFILPPWTLVAMKLKANWKEMKAQNAKAHEATKGDKGHNEKAKLEGNEGIKKANWKELKARKAKLIRNKATKGQDTKKWSRERPKDHNWSYKKPKSKAMKPHRKWGHKRPRWKGHKGLRGQNERKSRHNRLKWKEMKPQKPKIKGFEVSFMPQMIEGIYCFGLSNRSKNVTNLVF